MMQSSREIAMTQPVTAVTAATVVSCVGPTHTSPNTRDVKTFKQLEKALKT